MNKIKNYTKMHVFHLTYTAYCMAKCHFFIHTKYLWK